MAARDSDERLVEDVEAHGADEGVVDVVQVRLGIDDLVVRRATSTSLTIKGGEIKQQNGNSNARSDPYSLGNQVVQ